MPTKGFYAYATSDPGAPCLVDANGTRTRGEVLERTYRLANGLRALGLSPRDRAHICMLAPNRSEFLDVMGGSAISGTILTCVNWHLKPQEIAYIVDDCDAKVLFCDAGFGEIGLDAAERADDVETVVAIGGELPGAVPFEEWLADQSPDEPDDVVAGGQMLYSSGTTGRPKGVERLPYSEDPDENYEVGARLREQFPTTDEGAWLVTGPLYHAAPFGYTRSALHRGSKIVIMDRFSAEGALDLIEEHAIDSSHLVPTMFSRLLALPEERKRAFDPSNLRMILHGAAPCPPSVKERMIDWWGPVIWEYYGATEGGLTLCSSEEWLERRGTVGKALPFWDMVVVDADGNELPPGETGTIYFRAKLGRTFQYHKDPEKTQRAHLGDDLFTLGDIGYVDGDGYVFITDRKADMIISGGVNIYPAEVENCLHAHPAVADVAVLGVPNEEWGEEVKAVVELADDHEPTDDLAAEIIGFARDRIAHYKCPRSVDFTEALPRTEAGKLYKRRLKERYWEGAGRAI